MRTAALGFCLSGFMVSALPSLTRAALQYSVKSDADMFRTETLDPPPLANLPKGEALLLLHRGALQSQVETEGGLRGWMRNEDVLAMAPTDGQNHAIGSQQVTGSGDLNATPLVLLLPPQSAEVLPLDRSFTGEIPEAVDKEQLEMRHGEN